VPGASCQQQLCGFSLRVESKCFFPFVFEHELYRLGEIAKAFFLRLTLAIGAGYFQARCPESPFFRLTTMNKGRELFHTLMILRHAAEQDKFSFAADGSSELPAVASRWQACFRFSRPLFQVEQPWQRQTR